MTDIENLTTLLKSNNELLLRIYTILSKDLGNDTGIKTSNVIDLKELAALLGTTYCTKLPTIKVNQQFKNLVEIVNNYKFETVLLKWLEKKKDIIPGFWELPVEQQRQYCKDAIFKHKDLIISCIQPKLVQST